MFSAGLRIVDKGIWWFFLMYVFVAIIAWFELLTYMYKEMSGIGPDVTHVAALLLLASAIGWPAYFINRYLARRKAK